MHQLLENLNSLSVSIEVPSIKLETKELFLQNQCCDTVETGKTHFSSAHQFDSWGTDNDFSCRMPLLSSWCRCLLSMRLGWYHYWSLLDLRCFCPVHPILKSACAVISSEYMKAVISGKKCISGVINVAENIRGSKFWRACPKLRCAWAAQKENNY